MGSEMMQAHVTLSRDPHLYVGMCSLRPSPCISGTLPALLLSSFGNLLCTRARSPARDVFPEFGIIYCKGYLIYSPGHTAIKEDAMHKHTKPQ